MNDKSAAALEREAEAVRSQVANTAESLRDKMNPGELFDEFRGYFSNSDSSVALNNLKKQVRDNPLPLALIGAGLAWFFLGGGPSADRLRRSRNDGRERFAGYDDDDIDEEYLASSYTDEEWDGSGMDALGGLEPTTSGSHTSRSGGSHKGSMKDKAGSMVSGASEAVGGAASSISDAAGSAYSTAGNAASSAASTIGHAASAVGGTASSAAHAASMAAKRAVKTGRMLSSGSSRMTRRVRDGYADILSREPLVLGALGLAVGSAIGVMLPRTEYEDQNLGPYRDRLRDEAGKRVGEGLNQAKDTARDIAESTYRAAKDEADRQGLMPESEQSLAGRVSKVASTAAATAEKKARDKMEPGRSRS